MTDLSGTDTPDPNSNDGSQAMHYFMPWLRQGLSTQVLQAEDGGDGSTVLAAGPMTAQLSLQVSQSPDTEVNPAAVTVNFYGPWNVTGFHVNAIIRTWPRPNVFDAEANHYPLIEFSDPDLPWRYTPAQANSTNGRLRPWLCLVVLADDEIKAQEPANSSHPLPTVEPTQVSVLPDLKDSWAWAHVQALSQQLPDKDSVFQTIQKTPAAVISRIVFTKPLQPRTSYTAFLVPAFKSGLDAAMGKPGLSPKAKDPIDPAWTMQDSQAPILPFFYQWRFQTSELGDFKYFVNLLKPMAVPLDIGKRDLSVKNPGEGLPSASATDTIDLEGVLLSPDAPDTPWSPDAQGQKFVSAVAQLLNLQSDPSSQPVLVPPLYAQWHAEQDQLKPGQPPLWFQELNSDPKLRVAAGLGTLVVQKQEKQLLLGAWGQFGPLNLAHTAARHHQLSREVSQRAVDRHLTPAPDDSLFQTTGPLWGKMTGSPVTLRHLLHQSPIARGALEPQFRRIQRPFGPIGRRQNRPALLQQQAPSLLERMNSGSLSPAPKPPLPPALTTPGRATPPAAVAPAGLSLWLLILGIILLVLAALAFLLGFGLAVAAALAAAALGALGSAWKSHQQQPAVSIPQKTAAGTLQGKDIQSLPPNPTFVAQSFRAVVTQGAAYPQAKAQGAGPDSPSAAAFRKSAAAVLNRIQSPGLVRPAPVALDFAHVRSEILRQIDPQAAFARRYAGCVKMAPGVGRNAFDPLDPPMPYPKFFYPMYEYLYDLGIDWVLPGAGDIPQNSVTLLRNNPKVIEAYLLGLNHEMGRKLLWNNYPTDERGDYFQHFWNVDGLDQATLASDPSEKDIDLIENWDPQSQMGEHKPAAEDGSEPADNLVLLVRGELLHRYPNTLVYATKAQPEDPKSPYNGKHVPSLNAADEIQHVFTGTLGPDVQIFGFPLTKEVAMGGSNRDDRGYFFVFQQIPTEPQFAYDVNNPNEYSSVYQAGVDHNSAMLAAKSFRNPMRVAIHATRMLNSNP